MAAHSAQARASRLWDFARARRGRAICALALLAVATALTAAVLPSRAEMSTSLVEPQGAAAGGDRSNRSDGSEGSVAASGAATLTPSAAGAQAHTGAGSAAIHPQPTGPAASTAGQAATRSRLRVGLAYSDTLPWTTAAKRGADLDDAVNTHSGWIRIDLPWLHIQPESAAQQLWSRYDPTVAAARSRGLDVLFTVGQAPPWAQDPACRGQSSCPPAGSANYARFVGAAAAHYAPMGVHAYEIWNEPNHPTFWNPPDPSRYGQLVSAAAKAAHASDPDAMVIIGGLAATAPGSPIKDQLGFLSGVCATGACTQVDGVGYHPYTFPVKASLRPDWVTPWTLLHRTSPSISSVLQRYGVGGLPIWITEYGAPTGGPGRMSDGSPERADAPTDHVSEAVQAALASDVVATAAADSSIAALFWYQQQDNSSAQPSREAYFGLRRADGSAKPAFAAFAAAVARLPAG